MTTNFVPVENPQNTEKVNDFFTDIPAEVSIKVELPSRGKWYKSQVAELTPLTFDDEKAILLAKRGNQNPVDIILSRCIKNIPSEELLDMDKLYLLYKIRQISIGDEYPVGIGCFNCAEENKLTIKFSELLMVQIPVDFENPKRITLPDSKKQALVRLIKSTDAAYISTPEDLLNNLWRFIIELNNSKDSTIISKILNDKRFTVNDANAILKSIKSDDYGIQNKVKFKCVSCGYINTVDIPITEDFLLGN